MYAVYHTQQINVIFNWYNWYDDLVVTSCVMTSLSIKLHKITLNTIRRLNSEDFLKQNNVFLIHFTTIYYCFLPFQMNAVFAFFIDMLKAYCHDINDCINLNQGCFLNNQINVMLSKAVNIVHQFEKLWKRLVITHALR